MSGTAHRLRRALVAPFSGHPALVQWVRWPRPWRAPWRQPRLVLHRPGALGDVVLATAVFAELRRRQPAQHLTFLTEHTELLADHPLLDRVVHPAAATAAERRAAVDLRYEVFTPLRRHMLDYYAACVGLDHVPRRPVLPDFAAETAPLLATLPAAPPARPRVIFLRRAGPFTPNKDWPNPAWRELVARLAPHATLVEIGAADPAAPPPLPGVTDLRGRTTIRQLGGLIATARLVLTPISAPVHIAAAYGVPVLSIMSGYEAPENSAYPNHTAITHPVPCAPCWLRTPCPHGLACLHGIAGERVFNLALKHLAASVPAP